MESDASSTHSSTSVQKKPSPVYPIAVHSHSYPAPSARLVHVARGSQSAVPAAHSSRSSQLTPSPVYPAGHAQAKEPARSVQWAASKQLCAPVAHSSIYTGRWAESGFGCGGRVRVWVRGQSQE